MRGNLPAFAGFNGRQRKVRDYTVVMGKGQGYIQGENNKDNSGHADNLVACVIYFDLVYSRSSSSIPAVHLRGKKGIRLVNNH